MIKKDALQEAVAKFSHQPYVPYKTDCFVFVMEVLDELGIVPQLPGNEPCNNLRELYHYAEGTLVFKKKDLKRGDLIFFSRKGRGAAHVGIYLTRGMIVHCSKARGGVSTELLDEMIQRYAAFMPFGYPWIAKRMRR